MSKMTVNELIERLGYVDGNKIVYIEGFYFSCTIDIVIENKDGVYLRVAIEDTLGDKENQDGMSNV